jgi:murein L,D-transpeptidase YafK
LFLSAYQPVQARHKKATCLCRRRLLPPCNRTLECIHCPLATLEFDLSMRVLLTVSCLLFASVANATFTQTIVTRPLTPPAASPLAPATAVDKLLVIKSARQLQLISHGVPVKTYKVSLGKQPHGPKEREGDKRTPEGLYWVDWRKVSDRFNLALHLSYPNTRDAARARDAGVEPGSMIMIHGTPASEDYPEWYFQSLDWTDGCIALKNDDMREVWSLVKDGTLIEIRP